MHHHEPLDAVAVGEGRREPLDPRRYRPAFTLRLLEPVLHEDQWGRRRADPSRRCAPWMNRPSGATSHGVYQLGASPASAARRWNSTSGSPTRGGGPIATVTAIMVLSPLRKNSSRPFRAQSGVEPPPLETCASRLSHTASGGGLELSVLWRFSGVRIEIHIGATTGTGRSCTAFVPSPFLPPPPPQQYARLPVVTPQVCMTPALTWRISRTTPSWTGVN